MGPIVGPGEWTVQLKRLTSARRGDGIIGPKRQKGPPVSRGKLQDKTKEKDGQKTDKRQRVTNQKLKGPTKRRHESQSECKNQDGNDGWAKDGDGGGAPRWEQHRQENWGVVKLGRGGKRVE